MQIKITEKFDTPEEGAELLRKIADMLDEGYEESFDPNWIIYESDELDLDEFMLDYEDDEVGVKGKL